MARLISVIIHAPHLMTAAPLPPGPESPAQAARRTQVSRPAVWDELHRRALAHDGSDDTGWLWSYERRIIGGCRCRDQWRQDIDALPPDFTHYFEWTVAIHNAVNARLKKPILTVESARAIWSQPLPADPGSTAAVG